MDKIVQQKSNNSSGKHSKEVEEVMNLPDCMDKKKGQSGSQMKTNQEIILEMQNKKKDALSKVNSKYVSEMAHKSAEELHGMKMVIPRDDEQIA